MNLRSVAAFARRVTEEGWILVAFSFAAAFFGWAYASVPLVLIALVLVALFAWDSLYGLRVLRKTRLRHRVPSRARVDLPIQIELELRNDHPWLPLSGTIVRDALEGQAAAVGWAVFPWISAGETRRVKHRLVVRRRGLHRFETSLLRSGFPLGFVRGEVERAAPAEILVHPRIGRVSEGLFARIEALEPSRRARRSSRSEEEFRGLREWRHGDNPRWIHWRKSARMDAVLVKEYEEPRSARLTLALETSARSPAERSGLEEAISFAASLARACLRRGMELSLLFADPEPRFFELEAGRGGIEALLDTLARAKSPKRPALGALLAQAPTRMLRARLVLLCGASRGLLPEESELQRIRQLGGLAWALPADEAEFSKHFRRPNALERFVRTRRESVVMEARS